MTSKLPTKSTALSEDGRRRGRQLRNSIRFEAERELVGAVAAGFQEDILQRLATSERRVRALKAADAVARGRTVNVLLANLAVAALNRANPRRFVAVSMSTSDYAGTPLSYTAMRFAFETLQKLGLAEGKKGVGRPGIMGEHWGMLSRLRATRPLRDLMKSHRLSSKHIRNPPRDIIVLKRGVQSAGPEPTAVSESKVVLERVNELLASTDLHLEEDVWADIIEHLKGEENLSDDEKRHRQYVGDMTAKQLYRVFNGDWSHGGRLYGGWWMGTPKLGRRRIEIDGEPTVELDYGQLHPTMLFARIGRRLDYDPYEFGGFSRELGKDTFMRLLNRTSARGGRYIRRAGTVPMPNGVSAAEYTELYKRHLSPVRHLLGVGMGLKLQREDSDLALAVLNKLSEEKIVALPVHDSFIVQAKHVEVLKSAMVDCFRSSYGFEPVVK